VNLLKLCNVCRVNRRGSPGYQSKKGTAGLKINPVVPIIPEPLERYRHPVKDPVEGLQVPRLNRERVSERAVHAKGAGAYGTFNVTGDITKYTRPTV
jgi:hypothetical protein